MSAAARRAYGATDAARAPREREADVFRRITGALRSADAAGDPMAQVRAIADNRRLWLAVEAAALHPANQLPAPTRAGLVSLGRAVLRDMNGPAPDLGFLIGVNEQVAAGLGGG